MWFPMNATTAVANQRQRGATAAATSSTASSLLGPAFAALKSSAGGSSAAGQWLVGKKPATLTMSSSGRGGVLVQARMKGKKRREKEKNSCLSPSSLSLSLPPRFFFHSFSIQSGPRRREEARGRLRSLPRGLQDGPPLGDDGEEEEEEEEGGSGRGGWVLVAGVREDPAPSFRSSSPPSGGNASPYAQGDGTWAPRGEGQVRARLNTKAPNCYLFRFSVSLFYFSSSTKPKNLQQTFCDLNLSLLVFSLPLSLPTKTLSPFPAPRQDRLPRRWQL